MQNCLIVSLCIIATFISIEARPWYDESYDTSGEDSYDEFSEQGYSEQAFDSGYRSDSGYGNRIASNSRGLGGYSSSNYDNSGDGSSGYSNNGYGSSGFGTNGDGNNGYEGNWFGNNGYGSNGYEGNGFGNNGYGNNGSGANVRRGNGRGNGRGSGRGNGRSNGQPMPMSCPHCRITNIGNGENSQHTFNVPKEAFD